MNRPFQAYLIGGPAHGDVKLIDRPVNDILIPLETQAPDISYRSTTPTECSFSRGRYIRGHELRIDGEYARCVSYIWAGIS